jgi:hypothetical protein
MDFPPEPIPKAKPDRSGAVPRVQCPHCTEWNRFPEFEGVKIFICDYCGEPVAVDETV